MKMSMNTEKEDSKIGYTTFFSLKGGVGKTSLASAISLELSFINQPVPVITNDPISPLEDLLGIENAMLIQQGKEIPNSFEKDEDVIIDLGGFVDERSIPVLEKAKTIIVPTLGSFLSLSGLVGTLKEVERFNKNIIIVLNKADKKEEDGILLFIKEKGNYPIFSVKTSKCFENIHYQKKSVAQMMVEQPLRRRSYDGVSKQIWAIINHLKEN
jgi:cellulose biosynthesis protein BcsQ